MAALAFCLCSALQEIYAVTNVIVQRRYNLRQSLLYLEKQKRLKLFYKYCQQVWQIEAIKDKIRRRERERLNSDLQLINNMQRGGIDFAAIEASAAAFESLDGFSARDGDGDGDNFLDNERYHHNQSLNNMENIEIITGDEIDSTFYEYVDTLPVFHNDAIGPVEEGVSLTVSGQILVNCERFSINLILDNDSRDIALHINPRLPQSYIVRNTKARHVWGAEEVTSPQPFTLHRGEKFAIQVLVTDACYMISVNGQHFAEYAHRLPYSAVTILEVKGDVSNVEMERSIVNEYPTRIHGVPANQVNLRTPQPKSSDSLQDTVDNADKYIPKAWRLITSTGKLCQQSFSSKEDDIVGLSLPYYGMLEAKSLKHGRCLVIEGRVKLLPHSFYINLQNGQNIWPHPVIAFHFNPRFSKQSAGAIGKAVVCRNAWFNGKWAEEERSELDTKLLPGKNFNLAIVCGESAFEVYVNHKHITSFQYRVLPDVVDTIYIQGDIKLFDVALQENYEQDIEDNFYTNSIYENSAYVRAADEDLLIA